MDSAPDANAVLRGGPSSLAPNERICRIEHPAEKIKLLRGNRYEHFEPTAEIEQHHGREMHIYIWTGCTYVAG